MKPANTLRIDIVPGAPGAQQARAVRDAVFVDEQGIPATLEWDGLDGEAVHALARGPDGVVIGTARLLRCGRIGRMAVDRQWRRRGIGTALLRALLARARHIGMESVFLHAQRSAVPFYARQGFEPAGEPFMEADIEHQRMEQRPCPPRDD